ncbi:xanthine dehydrogenase family protein molybdopterin-binding subunit [Geobacter pickeringii]|uniref:Twin-arginine translocation pathway signal protein n=1 Tax=Geobacter pickeringii TaxID=345632 RepID=A0A0B5B899_9BACT|nr:molybdopterin cofactor-binding domain-containing protein [Geobacter pickeringii]AJE02782.1 twin-arginine translocation pathway signal protein [Geobacter pickeringii]
MSGVVVVTRREFLGTLVSAGAFVLSARLFPGGPADAAAAGGALWHPGVYLGIEPGGTVIIITHRSEMGTGIRTALPMVAADELDADWQRVRVEQALGDPRYGDQNTDGSKSIRDFYDAFRTVGATGRLMLERAAAARWGVPAAQCRGERHEVVHAASGRRLGYGELVADASRQAVPAAGELRFKTPAEFRYIGKGVPIVDMVDICTGKAIFGYDARIPGMVHAAIERSPVLGGRLASFDDRQARRVAGVRGTAVIDAARPPYGFQALGGVAVIADSSWAALQGRRKLKATWEPGPNAGYDSEAFRKSLQEAARKPQKVVRNIGDVDAAFARAARLHEAEYYLPHLAHASMEPPAAVADYRSGAVTVWTATQNPQAVQDTVAKALGIGKKDVICHVTLLGGAFGRKSKPDYVAEAAILSKKLGKPVKVAWSREDDIRFDYYHSVAAMYFKAATDAAGIPTAWLQRCVFPPIGSTFDAAQRYGGDGELAQGWIDVPFAIPNLRAENGPAQSHVRIGWLRSVANIYHCFGVQSFFDELAAAAGRDRVDYFLQLLGPQRRIDFGSEGTKNVNYGKPLDRYPWDTGRLRRVVELVAERSGWGKKKPAPGHGFGFAAHRSFLTSVAVVVELEVDDKGGIRIPRVDVALDAGRVVHPERVRAQFEGAAVFAASIALMGEITAANGAVRQSNYHDYPVARMGDAPVETHVHLVASDDLPTGVGEPGVPPVVPAICNAFFAATGTRVRRLPLRGAGRV